MPALYVAPLCPAGHLPRKGGDSLAALVSPIVSAEEWRNHQRQPISPLAGEMSGRTEGGAKERNAPHDGFTSGERGLGGT